MTKKQILNKQRHNFLLTFFDKDEYSEKEVNGFWLVKHWNGSQSCWQVAIYPKGHLKRKSDKL